jgi:hypothetical protein
MAKPLRSLYAQDSTSVDTDMTINRGPAGTVAALAQAMDDAQTEVAFITDTTGAPYEGLMVVDDELIAYHSRFGVDQILDLERGYAGTIPVAHLEAAEVEFHPFFYVPEAITLAMIAMQEKLNELDARVAVLEAL